MKILLLQPAPSPQGDLLPRRSPAVDTRLEKPGLPRAGKQAMEREGILPLQAGLDGCTSPEQEWKTNLLQADVGVKPETSTSNKPLLARSSRDHRRSGSSKG